MKKIISIGFMMFVLTLVSTSVVLAAEGDHSFDLGTELYYAHYEEPDVMEEDGIFYGVSGKYIYRPQEEAPVSSWSEFVDGLASNLTAGADLLIAFGQMDYESNGTGTIDGIDDYTIETRGILGYDFAIKDNNRLTPYFGFGYRYLNDDSSGKTSSTGHFGYERENHKFYMPFGIEWQAGINEGWTARTTVEYDLFLGGKQKSHLEDVSTALTTVENDQNSGYGIRGSVAFEKEMETWNLSIEPFVRYWEMDDSDVSSITCGGVTCAYGYEPNNKTVETGVKVGMAF